MNSPGVTPPVLPCLSPAPRHLALISPSSHPHLALISRAFRPRLVRRKGIPLKSLPAPKSNAIGASGKLGDGTDGTDGDGRGSRATNAPLPPSADDTAIIAQSNGVRRRKPAVPYRSL